MSQKWEIVLDTQEQRRKVAMLEGRARQTGAPAEDEVEFSVTIFPDQVSLNVPASTPGREFIARLTDLLGPPRLEPTIKCSCSWGQGIMGAMLIVLWDLPAHNPAPLQDLRAFLGAAPES
jgi:hypothetical protein